MPLGMPAYDCDPNTRICGGGFGGGNPSGYPWVVVEVPLFESYEPRLREPDVIGGHEPALVIAATPQTAPQTMQTSPTITQPPGNQQTPANQETAGGGQAVETSSLIVPVLIILAALAFGKG